MTTDYTVLHSTEQLHSKTISVANPILYTMVPQQKDHVKLLEIIQGNYSKSLHIIAELSDQIKQDLLEGKAFLSLIKFELNKENTTVINIVEKFLVLHIHLVPKPELSHSVYKLDIKPSEKENPETVSDYLSLGVLLPEYTIVQQCKEYHLVDVDFTFIGKE